MVDLDEMAKEQDAILQECAQLGLAFARDLKARVELVQSVADADALALAFYRVQRSIRLAVALRSRLVKDHFELDKLERGAAQKAVERRKAQVTAVLDREIFTEERDQDEADALSERLTERLDHDALFDDFLTGPIDRAIARIRKDIGLPDELLTSPIAAAMAGGGPSAEERMVEGASGDHGAGGSPPPPPALRCARPAVPLPPSPMGEVRKKPGSG